MKFFCLVAQLLLLSACSLSNHQHEINQAELIFKQFNCQAIDLQQIQNSVLGDYHYATLTAERNTIETYIRAYKNGETLFDLPLDQVIRKKLEYYQVNCQSLGGVLAAAP